MDNGRTSAYDKETWKQLLEKIRDADETANKESRGFIERVNTILDNNKGKSHSPGKEAHTRNKYR